MAKIIRFPPPPGKMTMSEAIDKMLDRARLDPEAKRIVGKRVLDFYEKHLDEQFSFRMELTLPPEFVEATKSAIEDEFHRLHRQIRRMVEDTLFERLLLEIRIHEWGKRPNR